MAIAKYRILVAILVMLALVIAIIWSFAKGQFYTASARALCDVSVRETSPLGAGFKGLPVFEWLDEKA